MKTLIFGNSGSGKSTLAKQLANTNENKLETLDLDTLAWQAATPPLRSPLKESEDKIREFTSQNDNWIIEGCYADLLQLISDEADEIIFMNLDIDACRKNARSRPWEPHKYPDKEAQDKNLHMLIEWIENYFQREDEFSFKAHSDFYDSFKGKKIMLTENNIDNRGITIGQ